VRDPRVVNCQHVIGLRVDLIKELQRRGFIDTKTRQAVWDDKIVMLSKLSR